MGAQADDDHKSGWIIIINGAPRAGKSSIAESIQDRFDGVWLNLGLDLFKSATPKRYQPGIGLRPGGERPDLEPLIQTLYDGMYESIAAHSRLGLNVVVDDGHHDNYSNPLGTLTACAKRLQGLPVLFVGVRCPIDIIMKRRIATWGQSLTNDGGIPDPIKRFQRDVHVPGVYDLEVDTSQHSPEECTDIIRKRLEEGPPPTAFQKLADAN